MQSDSSKPENPHAFPTHELHERFSDERCQWVDEYRVVGGMTLRDYFAAAALTGLLVNPAPDSMEAMGAAECASEAYSLADSMLAERAKAEGR